MKLYILLIYNLLRIILMKCRLHHRLESSLIQRISPRTSIKSFGNGCLRLGRNLDIAPYCDIQVHGSGLIEIGDNTYINRYCMISSHQHVQIGSKCMFGPGVRIFDNNHKFSIDGVSCNLSSAPISIGDRTWLGSNVIVLKGATIGKNCVIGAGCIISGTIPDNTIVRQTQTQTLTPIDNHR